MVVLTGLWAEGLHQCERLRAAVWEMATGQPHLGGRDIYRSCTTAGEYRHHNILGRKILSLFFKMSDVAISCCLLSPTDFWNLFGPELSEWHRSCASELVRKWSDQYHMYPHIDSTVFLLSVHSSFGFHSSVFISQHETFQPFFIYMLNMSPKPLFVDTL